MSRVAACTLFLLLSGIASAQSAPSATAPDLSQEAFVFEHLNESVRFEDDGSGMRESTAATRIES